MENKFQYNVVFLPNTEIIRLPYKEIIINNEKTTYFHFTSGLLYAFSNILNKQKKLNINEINLAIINFIRITEDLLIPDPLSLNEKAFHYLQRVSEMEKNIQPKEGRITYFPTYSWETGIIADKLKHLLCLNDTSGDPYSWLLSKVSNLHCAVKTWLDVATKEDSIFPENSTSLNDKPKKQEARTYNVINNPEMPFIHEGKDGFEFLANADLREYPKKVKTYPSFSNDYKTNKLVMAKIHESDNPIALCWSEIWYALEHQIKARICPYCGKVFRIPPNNPNTKHCQSYKCKKANNIEKMGGIEKYLEWDRERKKRPKYRKRGRPPKKH